MNPRFVGRKHNRLLALAAAGLVVIAISLLSGPRVPLYDGVGFPDEPYRYVVPPSPSKHTKLSVQATQVSVTLQNGTNNNYVQLASNETGPQVSIYLSNNSIQTAPSAATATLSATPLVPDKNQPPDGPVLGNIYRVTAASSSSSVKFTGSSSNPSFIDLRLPQGYPVGAKVVYRPSTSGPWTSFITTQIGNDIYQAPLIGFGDYGLIASKPTAESSTSSGKKHLVLIVAIGCFIAALALAVVLIRAHGDDHAA